MVKSYEPIMAEKEKFELEYLLKSSPKVLESLLFNLDGLSEWFADDVNCKDDIYTFSWDGSEEEARLLSKKTGEYIRWKWLSDEDDGLDTYFELNYKVDPMTKTVVFKVIDFAVPSEKENAKRLWDLQVNDLRRIIGA